MYVSAAPFARRIVRCINSGLPRNPSLPKPRKTSAQVLRMSLCQEDMEKSGHPFPYFPIQCMSYIVTKTNQTFSTAGTSDLPGDSFDARYIYPLCQNADLIIGDNVTTYDVNGNGCAIPCGVIISNQTRAHFGETKILIESIGVCRDQPDVPTVAVALSFQNQKCAGQYQARTYLLYHILH